MKRIKFAVCEAKLKEKYFFTSFKFLVTSGSASQCFSCKVGCYFCETQIFGDGFCYVGGHRDDWRPGCKHYALK